MPIYQQSYGRVGIIKDVQIMQCFRMIWNTLTNNEP